MKRFALLGIGVIMLAIALGSVAGQAQEKGKPMQAKETLKTVSGPLPNSLDALYPPQAGQPLFLFEMLGLGTRFSGIVADLSENKLRDAVASFEMFSAQYVEVSKLVPEWRRYYPQGPVTDLGAALKTGDRARIYGGIRKGG